MSESSICHCWNDNESGEAFECRDGQSASSREVVAVGVCRALEQTEHSQTAQLSRQSAARHLEQEVGEIASSQAMNIELGSLHGAKQRLGVGVEEVQALEGPVAGGLRMGDALEGALTAAVVVEAGEERQVALVAAEQYLAQVNKAVDGFLWTGTLSVDAKRRGALSTDGRFGRLRRTGNRPAVDNAGLLTARFRPRWLATRRQASAAQMPPATGCPTTNGDAWYCSSQCTRPAPAGPRHAFGSARHAHTRP